MKEKRFEVVCQQGTADVLKIIAGNADGRAEF